MLPQEIQESLQRFARELHVDPDLVAAEYEKILRSHRLEKLDALTRHQEALQTLRFRLFDRLQIRKFRKGRLEPLE